MFVENFLYLFMKAVKKRVTFHQVDLQYQLPCKYCINIWWCSAPHVFLSNFLARVYAMSRLCNDWCLAENEHARYCKLASWYVAGEQPVHAWHKHKMWAENSTLWYTTQPCVLGHLPLVQLACSTGRKATKSRWTSTQSVRMCGKLALVLIPHQVQIATLRLIYM